MKTQTLGPALTEKEIAQALARPRDFGWFGDRDETFVSWALGPVIQHRDSGVLDKSNARCLLRGLASAAERGEIEPASWEVVSANHWAVGWVEHLRYRVTDETGACTRTARWVRDWFAALDDYPVADEGDLGELTVEAEERAAEDAARYCQETRDLIDTLPEGWLGDLVCHLADAGAFRDEYEHPYVSEDDIVKAFRSLGWLPETADEEETP